MEEEGERVIRALDERLEKHDDNRRAVQEQLHNACNELRKQIDEMEERINSRLEEEYTKEDTRLQSALNNLRERMGSAEASHAELSKAIRDAGGKLFRTQSYRLVEGSLKGKKSLANLYELKKDTHTSLEWVWLEVPTVLNTVTIQKDKVFLTVTGGISNESFAKELNGNTAASPLSYRVLIYRNSEADGVKLILVREAEGKNIFSFRPRALELGETYRVRVKAAFNGKESEWSEPIEFRIPAFSECTWKDCPYHVAQEREYVVDMENPRFATKYGNQYSTIIGSSTLPLNCVVSWSVRTRSSKEGGSFGVLVGVAPSDIDQNVDNFDKCGWYFSCYDSTLRSGPPHNHKGLEYGPRKEKGQYVHAEDLVGVVVDTGRGEVSFVVNGVSLGVAYKGILLNKPLVPCALIWNKESFVELVPYTVKENVNPSIPIPSNIVAKSDTRDSVTLTWDGNWKAVFYQIEMDESRFLEVSSTNSFTKTGLLPDSEHTFRVRAVSGDAAGHWSSAVTGRTCTHTLSESAWKECPQYAKNDKGYSLHSLNPRVAIKDWGNGSCTVIGNMNLLSDRVASWNIKILESKKNDGNGISVGVAPSDINQNNSNNYKECGWFIHCHSSTLWSGPPHNYRDKAYGPRKGEGQYVHTGDLLGVVVDTTKGDLSFALNGVNLGVAFEGIPLDKPLVPCAILWYGGDSVALDFSEVKEAVDAAIPPPSNITTRSLTWDSITLTWNGGWRASFYQIEIDGRKSLDGSTASTFTKKGLFPGTEHNFRIRTVKGNAVSEWSEVVKGRTQGVSAFPESAWKDCPGEISDKKRKYSLSIRNSRVATKSGATGCCTVIGNTPLPPGKVVSWNVKVLKSKGNNGNGIFVGVAPFDINQNEEDSPKKCGWFFSCLDSSLWSGPPYDYRGREYGPRKEKGKYVRTGDVVGVAVDTVKCEVSFIVNGTNFGVAYESIPPNKPLVPCVAMYCEETSVELII